jgi:hypothetical protein
MTTSSPAQSPDRGRANLTEAILQAPDSGPRTTSRDAALRFALAIARAHALDETAWRATVRGALAGCNAGHVSEAMNDLRDAFEEQFGEPYTRARGIVALEYAIDPFAMERDAALERGIDDGAAETRRWRARVRRVEREIMAARAAKERAA